MTVIIIGGGKTNSARFLIIFPGRYVLKFVEEARLGSITLHEVMKIREKKLGEQWQFNFTASSMLWAASVKMMHK